MKAQRAASRREAFVALALASAAVLWTLMPVVPQPGSYHAFADQRSFLGIPNAADVLSNAAFVAVGILGLVRLARTSRPLGPVVRVNLQVFFVGLVLTGFASGYYHWAPSDATLVLDRLAMTFVFAGTMGAMLGERVSTRAGFAVLLLMLLAGPYSVLYWRSTGDVSLYAVIQFGGMAGILLLLSLTPRGNDPFPWWALMAWYAVSKVAEAGDVLVWNATRGLFAGHVVKHLAAAAGGLAIANALRGRARDARQRPVLTR